MKNIIKYYYDLDVVKIRQIKNSYYLIINNASYIFCPCDESLRDILNFLYRNPNYHQLILTVNKSVAVNFNDMFYALFKINIIDRKINSSDLLNNTYIGQQQDVRHKWIELWSFCVDQVELQLAEAKTKYLGIYTYAYYYIGLAENAIQFLQTFNSNNIPIYLVHKRVKFDMELSEFYNPCSLVRDTKIRDVAEYYKDVFFNSDSFSLIEIYSSIDNMSDDEKKLFLARMLYPTYFFDLFESVLNGKEVDYHRIINKANEYEKIIVKIINYIKKTTYIYNIDWFISQ